MNLTNNTYPRNLIFGSTSMFGNGVGACTLGLCSYDDEYLQYFYHTDHLGSSSWITDGYGYVNQYIQNLAYGEDFINQRSKEHDIRYKFTGKERDSDIKPFGAE